MNTLNPVFEEYLASWSRALDRVYAPAHTCEVLYASSDRNDEEMCGYAGIAQCVDCSIWLCKRCRREEGKDVLCESCARERFNQCHEPSQIVLDRV